MVGHEYSRAYRDGEAIQPQLRDLKRMPFKGVANCSVGWSANRSNPSYDVGSKSRYRYIT